MKKFETSFLIKAGLFSILCFTIMALKPDRNFSATETRNPGKFSKISLSIAADVRLVKGSGCKLEIEANEEDLGKIETVVNNGTLEIKTKNWASNISDKVTINIVLSDLRGLSVAGSGKIKSNSEFISDGIKLDVSGSGSVNLENNGAKKIDAVITGSGNIKLNGGAMAEHLGLTITGSGSYSSVGMKVETAAVTITGSGSAKIDVVSELRTNITGSGSVLYMGDPLVNANSTGSGKTKKM